MRVERGIVEMEDATKRPTINVVVAFVVGFLFSAVATAQHCPRAYSQVKTCSSHGCWGQVQTGYCGGPNDRPQECVIYQVQCCNAKFSFAEYGNACAWFDAACTPPTGAAIGRLISLGPKEGRFARVAVVAAVHGKTRPPGPRPKLPNPDGF